MAQAKDQAFDFYNPGDGKDEYKCLASSLVFQRGSVSQFDGKPIALRSMLGCLVRRVLSLGAF